MDDETYVEILNRADFITSLEKHTREQPLSRVPEKILKKKVQSGAQTKYLV